VRSPPQFAFPFFPLIFSSLDVRIARKTVPSTPFLSRHPSPPPLFFFLPLFSSPPCREMGGEVRAGDFSPLTLFSNRETGFSTAYPTPRSSPPPIPFLFVFFRLAPAPRALEQDNEEWRLAPSSFLFSEFFFFFRPFRCRGSPYEAMKTCTRLGAPVLFFFLPFFFFPFFFLFLWRRGGMSSITDYRPYPFFSSFSFVVERFTRLFRAFFLFCSSRKY